MARARRGEADEMEGEGTSGSGARGEEGRGGEERRNLKGHERRVKTAKGSQRRVENELEVPLAPVCRIGKILSECRTVLDSRVADIIRTMLCYQSKPNMFKLIYNRFLSAI